jgi:hypothetical protein
MHPRSSRWLAGIASVALLLYLSASAQIAVVREVGGFCDTAERECSSLPWTTARVTTWVLWGLAGVVLAATTFVAFRTPARRAIVAGLVTSTAFCIAAALILRTL